MTNREGPARLWIVQVRGFERGPPMCQHPNARLAPRGRETMVARIRGGEGVGEVARQMGAGRQTSSRRLGRERTGEPMGDRSGAVYAELLPDEGKAPARPSRRRRSLSSPRTGWPSGAS